MEGPTNAARARRGRNPRGSGSRRYSCRRRGRSSRGGPRAAIAAGVAASVPVAAITSPIPAALDDDGLRGRRRGVGLGAAAPESNRPRHGPRLHRNIHGGWRGGRGRAHASRPAW